MLRSFSADFGVRFGPMSEQRNPYEAPKTHLVEVSQSGRTTVLLFRVCLVAYAVSTVAVIVKILVIGHGPLPESAVAYLKWWTEEPQSALERVVGWIGLSTAIISIVSALAMAIFTRWARPVFAACVVLGVAIEPMMDYPILKTPSESFLDTLVSVLAGAVIVFSYWSKAGDRFAHSSS
jgi:hypothetical protein